MTRSTLPALVLLFLLVCPAVARPESTTCGEAEVPVARVIANLEGQIRANPNNGVAVLNLARVHAIAFARKRPTILRCPDGRDPEFPPSESNWNVPPAITPAADRQQRETAETHLRAAIAQYERAIALLPQSAFARLGYAWVLQQAGRTDRARAEYRQTVALAWPDDRAANERRVNPAGTPVFTLGASSGYRFVTEEAVRFLIPMLDPVNDAPEIATLRERTAFIAKGPRSISPIVIPLRQDATLTDLLDRSARVAFDLDGFGARRWTWVTTDAGWLVYDPRGTRQITSGLQLFGNVTFWLFWDTGYAALRALDDDGDGWLRDDELAGLAIWRDVNRDAVSQPDEVAALSVWGISELSVSYRSDDEDPDVLASSVAGVRFTDGSVRPTFDLILHAH